jgi:hypothetical protein
MKIKLLFSLAILAGFQSRVWPNTFTNLLAGIGQTNSLAIHAGQIARVVSVKWGIIGCGPGITVLKNGISLKFDAAELSQASSGSLGGVPTTVGPSMVSLIAGCTGAASCVIEIASADEPFTPSNAVVVPADSGGPVNIILESSTDLITWTPALPGAYGTSTEKRFFRVRAERTP